jgi:predicted transcriptional regulator
MIQRKKIACSITLDDDVVEKVDAIATALRTNFSALVNRTLAERFLSDQSRDMEQSAKSGGKVKNER